MTPLQARPPTSAPKAPSLSDVTGIADQVMGFVNVAIPRAVGIAYFIISLMVLLALWRQRKSLAQLTLTELSAVGILFALMR